MTSFCCALLAAVSVFDYPARQGDHERLKGEMVAAIREGDTFGMRMACKDALKLFPEDPVWNYNLACAYSKGGKAESAFEALEKAIRYGFRDSRAIANDADFKPISDLDKFHELLDLADSLKNVPVAFGPLAVQTAKADAGGAVAIGEHNLMWDFDNASFVAKLELDGVDWAGNKGDMYLNRDRGHSTLAAKNYPGLTVVHMGAEARAKGVDIDYPNTMFPYPVFGNCSRALLSGPAWRSLPRSMMTGQAFRLKAMSKYYMSNQVWVFPAAHDYPPLGKYGDVFASQTPYWIVTQGRSWSDQYYLRAALEASRSIPGETKKDIVSRGLLAPVIQTIIRKSLLSVSNDVDYLTAKAHPTAFPPNGLDMARLKKLAGAMTPETVPPVALIKGVAIGQSRPDEAQQKMPELTYVSPAAWAFVLRKPDNIRTFVIGATGAEEYAFAAVHGAEGAAKIEKLGKSAAKITLDKSLLTPTNRVDIAVLGKNAKTGWGAPAFVSFAVLDPAAPYCDPVLLGEPPKAPAEAK